MGALIDADRKQIEILYEIRDLLKQILSQDARPPDPYGVNQFFEDRGDNATLEMLIAASLPSSPDMQTPVIVGTIPTLIVSNDTSGLQYIVVSNDSIAQPIWVGPEGVTTASGRQVVQNGSVPFVLAPGAYLYGICNVATVSARVSRGFPIKDVIAAVREVKGA